MKLLLDIPKNKLEWIRKKVYPNYIDNAIKNGIVLDNLTNGEVIKKMFPHCDIEIDEHKGYVRVFYENFYTTYPLAWWNRKWGE